MKLMFYFGYNYRSTEWLWAMVRIKIMIFVSLKFAKWSVALSKSAMRLLDSQDSRLRGKGSNDAS